MRKRIAIFGSTGSIGTQALEVIDAYPDLFEVYAIAAGENTELLKQQARKFKPRKVGIANEEKYADLKKALKDLDVEILAGASFIASLASAGEYDILLSAMMGYAGLLPTLNAIKSGKNIALANKETMVVAGELVQRVAREKNVEIIPVDSEHSAIFQCLRGEEYDAIEKVILTASGGPFLGKDRQALEQVTLEDALNHPNWNMGDKITIDSASLMNKGLEAIEARWLFHLDPSQIEVVIHPQSVIHSMVQFIDGSVKAQLSLPDMRFPILYALGYPHRLPSTFERIRFTDYPELTFRPPDTDVFHNLTIAFECMKKGGNMPCVMNAANEVAVEAFRKNRLRFLQMPQVIDKTIAGCDFIQLPEYEDYVHSDRQARSLAMTLIKQLSG
jgi:1-deoxy-D-xylulose-5-phosphate reductoisomerase